MEKEFSNILKSWPVLSSIKAVLEEGIWYYILYSLLFMFPGRIHQCQWTLVTWHDSWLWSGSFLAEEISAQVSERHDGIIALGVTSTHTTMQELVLNYSWTNNKVICKDCSSVLAKGIPFRYSWIWNSRRQDWKSQKGGDSS